MRDIEIFVYDHSEMAVNEINKKSSVTVFPNPSNGKITIESKEKILFLSITDMTGQNVLTLNPGNYSLQADLSEKSNGIYFLKVRTNERIAVRKIIIQQ
jgi:hypothetical protein